MTLTELSIKRPSLIIIIFTALAVLGIFSYFQLQYELLPKFSTSVITITTQYPGASPSEVETGVSKVLEDAVSGLDQVSAIRSTSMEGVSFVMIELLQSANTDISLQDAQRKVGEIAYKLPAGAKTPAISKIALDEIPILRMGITADMDPKEFYQFLKDEVKPQLSKITGVGQIALIGGEEREIKINLDMQKLRSFGLNIIQVTNAIKNANMDFPTGKIKDTDGQYIVRIAGKFDSLEELKNLPVAKSKSGGEIKLTDIAEVVDATKDAENITRVDGKTMVGMNVQKQTDANAVEVSKLVKKELKALEEQYSDRHLKFDIAQDGSLFTVDAANAVKEDLAIAIILVAIVMLLFLHSIRNSIIVMIAIPSSLISTFIAMYAFGFTLNLMTLLGLSLVVGILVDDSIVVLENIYHHLEKGEDKRTAAVRGRNEIGFAALAITLVDVAVFLPLALTTGIIGNILRQFALVVVVSTLLSLFVSFTITPMLASRFAKLERLKPSNIFGRFAIWFEEKFREITEFYISALKWSFRHKFLVSALAFVALIASFTLIGFGFIGSEFIAVADRGEFAVTLELDPGSSIENTNLVSTKVERMISAVPEVQRMFVNVGASNEGLVGFSQSNVSEINVTLVPKNERKKSTDEVSAEIKDMIQKVPGVKVRVNPIGLFGTANQTPIQIIVSGSNYDEASKGAKAIEDIIKTIPGTGDVRLSSEDGKPETRIELDRSKLNTYGFSLAEVGNALKVAFTGDDDSKFRQGNTDYDLRIVLDEFDRSNTDDIGNLTFITKSGDKVYLKQFANIFQTTGPTKLTREDRNSSVTVYSQAIGRPSGSIAQDFMNKIKKVKLPEGTTYKFAGDIKNQNDSFSSLGLAFMAAILFTYMIMVALYDSFVYPLVVLFSVPLAIIGALLALALSMKSLSIFSILGIIMLIGLVGKNAILLVDRTNYMREQGEPVENALLDAGKMRIRPIVMTTLTMIFGMLPIALSGAEGSEWKSGLAWALIGGLTSSLILTLVIVPIVYIVVEKLRVVIPAFFKKVFARFSKNKEGILENLPNPDPELE